MEEKNVQSQTAKAAELPKWDEFVTMVETENTGKTANTPSAYYVYHKYSKTC